MPKIGDTTKNGKAGSPPPRGKVSRAEPKANGRPGRQGREGRVYGGYSPVDEISRFLSRYIVLSADALLVVAAWVVASYVFETFDRFPHLAVTSPEKRCGKTRMLELIALVAWNAISTANISPAAIYRLIAQKKPTLLIDEAQSMSRLGSESSEVIRELLNAGISRDAKVIRVGGKDKDKIQEFSFYSPKVIALIGSLDPVLADRCLPVELKRKTAAERVEPYRSRVAEPIGKEINEKVRAWADENAERIAEAYDTLEPFSIENDRMAELLLPLQAVLTLADPDQVPTLERYALLIDAKDAEAERMTPGIQLLTACREIFRKVKEHPKDGRFITTQALISSLVARSEEPWRPTTGVERLLPKLSRSS